jgi:hypothetical protein
MIRWLCITLDGLCGGGRIVRILRPSGQKRQNSNEHRQKAAGLGPQA